MNYEDIINQYSSQFKIDPKLLCAIIETESHWNPLAIRYEPLYRDYNDDEARINARNLAITYDTEIILLKCSFGLAQIMGGTARRLGHKTTLLELTRPSLNVFYACKLLAELSERYAGHPESIAASYNAGSVRRNSDGTYVNQAYVNKVKNNLAKFT